MKEQNFKVWSCKIGARWLCDLPDGSDLPMRIAICNEFKKLTGHDAEFCFSGWGEKLEEVELEIVEEDDFLP